MITTFVPHRSRRCIGPCTPLSVILVASVVDVFSFLSMLLTACLCCYYRYIVIVTAVQIRNNVV